MSRLVKDAPGARELAPGPPVTETDLAGLPEPARRYLRFMGVLGRPRDRSFRLAWRGQFRPRLDGPWVACEAWQHNTSPEIARRFRMRLRMWGLLPVVGRDLYEGGHGSMRIRLFDLLTVQDAHGLEYDLAELVTWLDDAVLFSPSMLLEPAVAWSDAGPDAFDLALTDAGRTVRARVHVNARGAPIDVETTDRWLEDPARKGRLIRARWTTQVDWWDTVAGRTVPTAGRAIWHLPGGSRPYAVLSVIPESLAWNVPPESGEGAP